MLDQCLFYRHFRSDVDDEDGLGECRRYPPVVVQDEDGPYSVFPLIDEAQMCGEFQRKLN